MLKINPPHIGLFDLKQKMYECWKFFACTVPNFNLLVGWCFCFAVEPRAANKPVEADASTAAAARAAEDGQVQPVLGHDPHAADAVLQPGGALDGLHLVRHRRPRTQVPRARDRLESR